MCNCQNHVAVVDEGLQTPSAQPRFSTESEGWSLFTNSTVAQTNLINKSTLNYVTQPILRHILPLSNLTTTELEILQNASMMLQSFIHSTASINIATFTYAIKKINTK